MRRSCPLWALLALFSMAAGLPAAAQTLTFLHTFRHPEVSVLAFSPNGKTLATGGGEWATPDCMRLWDVFSGKLLHTFRDRRDDANIVSLAFSPDGSTLAYACDDKVRLWSVRTGRLLRVFSGGLIGSIEISPHNRLLVGGGSTNEAGMTSEAQMWDLRTGRRRVLAGSDGVYNVRFSADGQTLIGDNSQSNAPPPFFQREWDAGTGEVQKTRVLPPETRVLVWSPDQNFFASSLREAKPNTPVSIWDSRTNMRVSLLPGPNELPVAAFSPSAPWLAIGESRTALWNWRTRKRFFVSPRLPWPMTCTVFSADGRLLATGSQDGNVQVWRIHP